MTVKDSLKAEIFDCRFHADCMSLLVKKYRKYDKVLNVVLAIFQYKAINV